MATLIDVNTCASSSYFLGFCLPSSCLPTAETRFLNQPPTLNRTYTGSMMTMMTTGNTQSVSGTDSLAGRL